MDDFYVSIGDQVTFAKTITESDVYQFAGITGDFSPIHVNAEYARATPMGQRVAHGVLLVGLMSTTGTLLLQEHERRVAGHESYSVGYDRIRFILPVFFGDTITVVDIVTGIDRNKNRCRSKVELFNQHGDIVCAAEHLIQWVKPGNAKNAAAPSR
jgi:3-hydroxybutyryl-CoA dehydratase